jgi:hypothetical protein
MQKKPRQAYWRSSDLITIISGQGDLVAFVSHAGSGALRNYRARKFLMNRICEYTRGAARRFEMKGGAPRDLILSPCSCSGDLAL